MYRRIVSYIRQSLTVALCLHDDEVVHICPSFPALSTCPSVRLEAWSGPSMQLAASRSLSAHLNKPGRIAGVDTTRHHNAAATGQGEKLATGGLGSVDGKTTHGAGSKGLIPRLPNRGGVSLWPGATHVHLIGALAFGRFQSSVTAFKDPPINSVSLEGDGGKLAEMIKRDANVATEDSQRLFDAWMVLATPACCVDVIQATEACAGGDGVLSGKRGSFGDKDQPSWGAVKARCLRVMAGEGRGPRPASVDDVLQLFKHICRLGCRRQEHARTHHMMLLLSSGYFVRIKVFLVLKEYEPGWLTKAPIRQSGIILLLLREVPTRPRPSRCVEEFLVAPISNPEANQVNSSRALDVPGLWRGHKY